MADKIDPFDIAALEKALNESATRVSTIWVSFLIFSLYLLTAATTVTHRQLFLAEPVKLPVLNIDLPLWGFFFLAPILFVTLHAYVLLQVLLLGRTAAAYNEAVDRAVKPPPANAAMRQRLANTLFAQIFAGSPRERNGWLGWLLKAMAWVTLAIAPILILLTFQFMFLPYHSHLATWTHRLLILAELAVMFLLWPLVLDARRDFDRPKLKQRLKQMAAFPFVLALFLLSPLLPTAKSNSEHSTLRRRLKRIVKFPFALVEFLLWSLVSIAKRDFKRSKLQQRPEFRRLRHQAVPAIACGLCVFLSLSLATFPGEPHVNLFMGQVLSSVQCERWFHQDFNHGDMQFDRLVLPGFDAVDDEKLAKFEKATSDRELDASDGERTRNFRDRDLNCSDLSSADLRRVDLTGARIVGANLAFADLQGASLYRAQLQRALLYSTHLQGAFLFATKLQGADLTDAKLQGADLMYAQMQGANLTAAKFQGASLVGAQLHGASFEKAELQGADLEETQLQGASLRESQLQGASLVGAQLHGASLYSAQLQGTSFLNAQLQGSDFSESALAHADFSGAHVWRAKGATCLNARLTSQISDAIIGFRAVPDGVDEPVRATLSEIETLIERSVADISDARVDENARKRMLHGLIADPVKDDTAEMAKVWNDCETMAKKKPQSDFDSELALFLRNLVCDATANRKALARGVIRNWIVKKKNSHNFSALLARGLLGQNGKDCAAAQDLDEGIKEKLRAAIVNAANTPPATAHTPSANSVAK